MIRGRMTIIVASLILVLASSIAVCQTKINANGYFYYTCVIGNQLDIKLTLPDARTFEFHFFVMPGDEAIKGPVSAQAAFCASRDHCENGEATVLFRHLTDKKASGRFTIEFHDGRKEEGVFKASHEKQPKPFICE